MALTAGASEVVGGAMIAAGLLTPLAAALLSGVMITAILTAHRGAALWASQGGFEYNVVLLAALFALSAVGAGEWSLDYALDLDMAGAGWAAFELAAGLFGAMVAIAMGRRSALGRRTPPMRPARGM